MSEKIDNDVDNSDEGSTDQPEYVKKLDPLYQRLREGGTLDNILNLTHDPVQLEAAEKLASHITSQYASAFHTLENISKDPDMADKLRHAIMTHVTKTQGK